MIVDVYVECDTALGHCDGHDATSAAILRVVPNIKYLEWIRREFGPGWAAHCWRCRVDDEETLTALTLIATRTCYDYNKHLLETKNFCREEIAFLEEQLREVTVKLGDFQAKNA